jgi:hypothetical protein
LSLEQIAFRREKLEEFDYDLQRFKAEYPLTLDECFQASGYSLFSVVPYVPHNQWIQLEKPHFWALSDTHKHSKMSRFAIGVDVGGGVRRDRSVIEVVDIFKWEQAAEYVVDNVAPDVLSRKIIELGRHYNDAYVCVETNNHGAVTLLKIREGFGKEGDANYLAPYPDNLIYMNNKMGDSLLDYGFKTTQRTKPILIGNLRKDFVEGLKIHSPALKDELSTFVEDENGKMGAQEGCFDDRVIAIAAAVEGAKSSPYIHERRQLEEQRKNYVDPLSAGAAIDELRAKYYRRAGTGFAIPRQDDPDGHPLSHYQQ